MIQQVIWMVILTFTPFLELRASMPWGMLKTDVNWLVVFLVCVIANILLAILLYFFIEYFMKFFLKIGWIEKIYNKIVRNAQKKLKPYVEKHGIWGLAVFIGIPLPGSGVYTAVLGAYLLGYKFKDYLIASIIGVLIAGIAVAFVVISGSEAFKWAIQVI